ncbi:PH domain-containing protein [uncultured Mucilaginibacter sp.]|uniref:PH domain-containing protein n=1 Tax=uncultured Mucilaginibacter sp. TaxID=797541 RepID=UPI0025FE4546|nr:PH domain-containing protein [uncultured Mucilaginibacter sp.]
MMKNQNESAETVIWEGKPSQLMNLGTYILCFLFIWLVFPIFIAIWAYIKTASTKFQITTQRIIISRGVWNRITNEMAIHKVIDTRIVEPLIQRLVGIANLQLFTVGDLTEHVVLIEGIKNSAYLRDEIRKFKGESDSLISDMIINNAGY